MSSHLKHNYFDTFRSSSEIFCASNTPPTHTYTTYALGQKQCDHFVVSNFDRRTTAIFKKTRKDPVEEKGNADKQQRKHQIIGLLVGLFSQFVLIAITNYPAGLLRQGNTSENSVCYIRLVSGAKKYT